MHILLYIALGLAVLVMGFHAWFRLRYFFYIFQLEGYKTNEFVHWLRQHGRVVFPLQILLGAVLVLGYFILPTSFLMHEGVEFGGAVLWMALFLNAQRYSLYQQKKPLAYTPRLKRVLATGLLLALLVLSCGWMLWGAGAIAVKAWLWPVFGVIALGPAWVLAAGYCMKPVERSIQNGFKRQAREKLAQHPDLIVVGITGSYGKTSTKFIIAEILGQRFNVLATPGSYNTPMGLCLVINNQLTRQHQVLVLEMGARYTGDIRELTELAPPDLAVVTSVGKAHLETMGPIENIARVKAEIIAGLKPNGISILNADDGRVATMAKDAPGAVWRVSVGDNPADLVARDLTYGPVGARFHVQDETGDQQIIETKLLGKHNVLNILLGLAVGRALGLPLRQMAHAVKRIAPVPHRLQLRDENGVTIIDDAFNANPVGAKNAVEILGQFTTGRRIIITPGMIELGDEQTSENFKFGQTIAHHVDLAFLIGPQQTRPIQDGLRDQNFPEENLHLFDSLFDAQDFLQTMVRPGDTVLYENDLPDQYNE